jgi:hypothetical protein
MPRYFFHVRDGTYSPDFIGAELADLDAARREAVQYSGAILKDSGTKFWETNDWSMEVKDDAGLTLFALYFLAVQSPSALQTMGLRRA